MRVLVLFVVVLNFCALCDQVESDKDEKSRTVQQRTEAATALLNDYFPLPLCRIIWGYQLMGPGPCSIVDCVAHFCLCSCLCVCICAVSKRCAYGDAPHLFNWDERLVFESPNIVIYFEEPSYRSRVLPLFLVCCFVSRALVVSGRVTDHVTILCDCVGCCVFQIVVERLDEKQRSTHRLRHTVKRISLNCEKSGVRVIINETDIQGWPSPACTKCVIVHKEWYGSAKEWRHLKKKQYRERLAVSFSFGLLCVVFVCAVFVAFSCCWLFRCDGLTR